MTSTSQTNIATHAKVSSSYTPPTGYTPGASKPAHSQESDADLHFTARVSMPLHVVEKVEEAAEAAVEEKVNAKAEVVQKTAPQIVRVSSYSPPIGYDPRARTARVTMPLHVVEEEKTEEVSVSQHALHENTIDAIAAEVDAALKKLREDAEAAEVAALASRSMAMKTQEAFGEITQSFASKLDDLSAAAAQRLSDANL